MSDNSKTAAEMAAHLVETYGPLVLVYMPDVGPRVMRIDSDGLVSALEADAQIVIDKDPDQQTLLSALANLTQAPLRALSKEFAMPISDKDQAPWLSVSTAELRRALPAFPTDRLKVVVGEPGFIGLDESVFAVKPNRGGFSPVGFVIEVTDFYGNKRVGGVIINQHPGDCRPRVSRWDLGNTYRFQPTLKCFTTESLV